ncbi:MAG: hypothetical protein WCC64_03110 [Aliidongia sp.]|jgi:hypothetical protein
MKRVMNFLLAGLVCAIATFIVTTPSLAQGLTVTIGTPVLQRSGARIFTFPANSAVASGGSGSYSFVWSPTGEFEGTWSGGAGQTFAPQVHVTGVDCTVASASYTATVTDTVTGATATSNSVEYNYDFMIPGQICP